MQSQAEVTSIIEECTIAICGEGESNISDDAIVIELEGPLLPNLTLIDLPGLVRTVANDEDESIIEKIRDLVFRFLVQAISFKF